MSKVREQFANVFYSNPFKIQDPMLCEQTRQEVMRSAVNLIDDCRGIFRMYNDGLITRSNEAEAHIRNLVDSVNTQGEAIKTHAPELYRELADNFQSAQGVYFNLKHKETLPEIHRLNEGNYSATVLQSHVKVNSPVPFPTPLETRGSIIPGEAELLAKFRGEREEQADVVNVLTNVSSRKAELEKARQDVLKKITSMHVDEVDPTQLGGLTREMNQHYKEVDATNRELEELKVQLAELTEKYNLHGDSTPESSTGMDRREETGEREEGAE